MRTTNVVEHVTACALLLALCVVSPAGAGQAKSRSWAADNGNGTYSNPPFYDEFSDPDVIRVGPDYYLTGTTMHSMPGLPVFHSRDLVNWRILGYAFERLDLGSDFRLEGGKEIYGQGIWAPCFRYHNRTYYIFANVNRFGLQVFRASDPRGPWKHNRIPQGLYDLSVLFDDDGKIYAVYGAWTIRIVELNADLTAVVPGTERIVPRPPEIGRRQGIPMGGLAARRYSAVVAGDASLPRRAEGSGTGGGRPCRTGARPRRRFGLHLENKMKAEFSDWPGITEPG